MLTTRVVIPCVALAALALHLHPAFGAPARNSDGKTGERHLSLAACQRDARQLVKLLELSHPDPYSPMGGKVAFKQRARALLSSLPKKGMSSLAFGELLQSFLAGLNDGHTRIVREGASWEIPEDALLILFDVNDQGLHLAGFDVSGLDGAQGFKLAGVNGVPLAGLQARLARLVPVENAYHAYAMLRRAVVSPGAIAHLLGRTDSLKQITYDLVSPGGARSSRTVVVHPAASKSREAWRSPPSKWDRLESSDQPFYYRFLDKESIAYFRVATIMGREGFEMAERYRWGDVKGMLEWYYRRSGRPMPQDLAKAMEGVPSFLEPAERLLVEMRDRRTKHLIVDLRGNGGGATPTVMPFLYQLFGDAYYGHRFPATFTTVMSQLYLDKYKTTLQAVRKEHHDDTIELGDYVAGQQKHEAASVARKRELAEYRQKKMSFAARLERLQGKAIYTPPVIVVVCDAGTYSAAFHFMYYLRDMGARVVGIPSGQAPNTPMEMTELTLSESRLRGSISNSAQVFLPDEPNARVLLPDFPLSYELMAKYSFEENAALHYAFDLITAGKIGPLGGKRRSRQR